jgi:hypothetical protein
MTNFGVELNLMTTPEQKVITPKYPFISTVLAADFLCNHNEGAQKPRAKEEPKHGTATSRNASDNTACVSCCSRTVDDLQQATTALRIPFLQITTLPACPDRKPY